MAKHAITGSGNIMEEGAGGKPLWDAAGVGSWEAGLEVFPEGAVCGGSVELGGGFKSSPDPLSGHPPKVGAEDAQARQPLLRALGKGRELAGSTDGSSATGDGRQGSNKAGDK